MSTKLSLFALDGKYSMAFFDDGDKYLKGAWKIKEKIKYKKSDGTDEEKEIEFEYPESYINKSNLIKVKSYFPDIARKEKEFKNLVIQFQSDSALAFYKKFINEMTSVLMNLLLRADQLAWKDRANFVRNPYTDDECIQQALEVAEPEIRLKLKKFDMENPFRLQQVSINYEVADKVKASKTTLGIDIIDPIDKQLKTKSKPKIASRRLTKKRKAKNKNKTKETQEEMK